MSNTIAKKGITEIASSIVDDVNNNNNNNNGNETAESGNGSVEEKAKSDADKIERGTSTGCTTNNIVTHQEGTRIKHKFGNLLNEEIGIRNSYNRKPGAQGRGGIINVVVGAVLNMVSAFLIFVLFLISLESLFSIALSVSLTICKYRIAEPKTFHESHITIKNKYLYAYWWFSLTCFFLKIRHVQYREGRSNVSR